jgi:hypothetical protein
VPSAKRKGDQKRRSLAFDKEQNMNYVLYTFIWEGNMIRSVVEEAAALVSIALFIGMIAVWAEVLSSGL